MHGDGMRAFVGMLFAGKWKGRSTEGKRFVGFPLISFDFDKINTRLLDGLSLRRGGYGGCKHAGAPMDESCNFSIYNTQ